MARCGLIANVKSVWRLQFEYLCISDLRALLQHLPLASPRLPPSGGWTSIDALWIMQRDLTLHLFLSSQGVHDMLRAIGHDVPAVKRKQPPLVYRDIHVVVQGKAHKLNLCPEHWKVRDVLVTLCAQNPALRKELPLDTCTYFEVTTRDGDSLFTSAYLRDVSCTTWSVRPFREERALILRGFPFAYDESDIRAFMRGNGVSDESVEAISMVRSSHNGKRFLGLVRVTLSADADKAYCAKSLHLAPARSRYIEALPLGQFKSLDRRFAAKRCLSEDSLTCAAIVVPLPS